jgi:hypothetical protein
MIENMLRQVIIIFFSRHSLIYQGIFFLSGSLNTKKLFIKSFDRTSKMMYNQTLQFLNEQ